MGCLINREGSDKSPLGTVPTCPSREGVLDPARALGATPPPPGSSVQPEFWGMQGMRQDFCWPGCCGRGLRSPAVGGCSLGMTLREGPLYPPPAITHQHRWALCILQPHGAAGAMGAPSSARPQLQLGIGTQRGSGTPTWARSRRGHPPAPASPPCPKATGAKGVLAPRPQPQERRGRALSAFSLPSPPHSQAHPILAALQKQTLKFPGLERRAAACGRLAGEGSFPLPS